ncbi:MAG: hypothetical protein LBS47_00515 [Endomicrobium sp.]|nr:hypothetical protein [Endomicrobium sp.]
MKRYFLTIALISIFSMKTFCFRNFVEKNNYFVEFQEKNAEMAAVLHVNFTNVLPEYKEAEEIVKQQLKIYGNMLLAKRKVFITVKKEQKYKNIIGSAWYINSRAHKNPKKIKFQKDVGAYVWLGKTRTILSFPGYISFLKRESITSSE